MGKEYCGCADCGKKKVSPDSDDSGGPGYGTSPEGEKVCYTCCAKRDIADMVATGRAVLYLTVVGPQVAALILTNWPGTLRIPVKSCRVGCHNLAGTREDVWFDGPDGRKWWGVCIGNTQICRCKRLKAT
jgi:hypothetical protein